MGSLYKSLSSSDISELYNNYSPAFKNLYSVEIFDYDLSNSQVKNNYMGSTNSAKSSYHDYRIGISSLIRFHSTSVKFNGETLNLERNSITKRFQVPIQNGYTLSDTLNITLRENDAWQVKRFHEQWMNEFYDREKDCWKSASDEDVKKRYKRIRVALPYSSKYGDYPVINFIVLPSNPGNIDLGWGQQSEVISHSITYKVENWRWEYEYDNGDDE